MAPKRRAVELKFHVTPEERTAIEKKMSQMGASTLAGYLRKMALDGMVVKLDLPELRELVSLLRRTSNSLNQIAKRVNTSGRLYQTDLEEIKQKQDQLWEQMNLILEKLAAIQ